jgi:hypothetical protein
MSNQGCFGCVYQEICKGHRRRDFRVVDGVSQYFTNDAIDCYIPEAPLRDKQRKVLSNTNFDVINYAQVTNEYIMSFKSKSRYWSEKKAK